MGPMDKRSVTMQPAPTNHVDLTSPMSPPEEFESGCRSKRESWTKSGSFPTVNKFGYD
jgi:hypothetical protein